MLFQFLDSPPPNYLRFNLETSKFIFEDHLEDSQFMPAMDKLSQSTASSFFDGNSSRSEEFITTDNISNYELIQKESVSSFEHTLNVVAYHIIAHIIIVIGILGNTLNLVVLSRPNLKGTMYVHLLGLAVCNLCAMLSAILPVHKISRDSDEVCGRQLWCFIYLSYFSVAVLNSFYASSIYIIICMTINRYISIYKPARFQEIHTTRNALLSIAGSIFCGFALHLPLVYEFNVLTICTFSIDDVVEITHTKEYDFSQIFSYDESKLLTIYRSEMNATQYQRFMLDVDKKKQELVSMAMNNQTILNSKTIYDPSDERFNIGKLFHTACRYDVVPNEPVKSHFYYRIYLLISEFLLRLGPILLLMIFNSLIYYKFMKVLRKRASLKNSTSVRTEKKDAQLKGVVVGGNSDLFKVALSSSSDNVNHDKKDTAAVSNLSKNAEDWIKRFRSSLNQMSKSSSSLVDVKSNSENTSDFKDNFDSREFIDQNMMTTTDSGFVTDNHTSFSFNSTGGDYAGGHHNRDVITRGKLDTDTFSASVNPSLLRTKRPATAIVDIVSNPQSADSSFVPRDPCSHMAHIDNRNTFKYNSDFSQIIQSRWNKVATVSKIYMSDDRECNNNQTSAKSSFKSTTDGYLPQKPPKSKTYTSSVRDKLKRRGRLNIPEERKLVIVMISIVMVFVICSTPAAILSMSISSELIKKRWYAIFRALANDLEFIGYSINFVVYCLASADIRTAFVEVLCWKKICNLLCGIKSSRNDRSSLPEEAKRTPQAIGNVDYNPKAKF